jgi:hypothetical protein
MPWTTTVDQPWTHRGQIQETPGQTVDTTVDTTTDTLTVDTGRGGYIPLPGPQPHQLDLFDATNYEPITAWRCTQCDYVPDTTNRNDRHDQIRSHVIGTRHPMVPERPTP